jgi:hypothetical protein
MTSRTVPVVATLIGIVQAAILLVNAFGWASITAEQGAAVTALVTAVGGLWGTRKVNDQVGIALHTMPPDSFPQI